MDCDVQGTLLSDYCFSLRISRNAFLGHVRTKEIAQTWLMRSAAPATRKSQEQHAKQVWEKKNYISVQCICRNLHAHPRSTMWACVFHLCHRLFLSRFGLLAKFQRAYKHSCGSLRLGISNTNNSNQQKVCYMLVWISPAQPLRSAVLVKTGTSSEIGSIMAIVEYEILRSFIRILHTTWE